MIEVLSHEDTESGLQICCFFIYIFMGRDLKRKEIMRTISMILILELCFLFTACKKDQSTGPAQDENFSVEASETIGSEGGILETEDFIMTIPAGAFNENNNLTLYAAVDNETFGDNSASRMFKVEGIPYDYNEEIEIGIKYEGTLSGNSYIAFGELSFVPSVSEDINAFRLLDATDSDGYMSCNIPVPEDGSDSEPAITGGKSAKNDAGSAKIMLVDGYHSPYITPEGNFRIKYPEINVSGEDVVELGGFLEEAFVVFRDSLKFSYSARNSFPIDITVRSLAETMFGWFAPSHIDDNYSTIEFNSSKMGDHEQMRLTAGHEFFHLVQYLYDPRFDLWKGGYIPDHHWLNEATAVWSEEYFTDATDYVSDTRDGWEHTPFNGFQKGGEGNDRATVGGHGYGMSAVIKYLVGRYGKGILPVIYQEIHAEGSNILTGETLSPVLALSLATENPTVWLTDFFREYMLNNLYYVNLKEWIIGFLAQDFIIKSDADNLKVFTNSYPDLSAQLYNIQLKYPDIDNDASISFEASYEGTEIVVFKYWLIGEGPGSTVQTEYLAYGYDYVSVPDIRGLTDENANLVVLVTNTTHIPPYTGTTDINLKVTVDKLPPELEYDACGVQIEVLGHYHASTEDDSYDYDSDGALYTWESYPGSFTGNTFTGSYSRSYGDELTITGTVSLTLNNSQDLIESISWTQNSVGTTGEGYVKTITFTGKNIPYAWEGHFEVNGEETCSGISSLSVVQTSDGGLNYSLIDKECNYDSKISVNFYKDY
jgi:hypothetical protein